MTAENQIFRAEAPVRLDFAGGWTDVPPFSTHEGGVVVNAAIGLTVHAEVELGGTGMFLRAEDQGEAMVIAHSSHLDGHGPLPLHRAALRMFPVGPCSLRTRSEVPRGSGLGSSGALDVALVSVLARARGETLGRDEAAEHGWELEALEAGLPGGRQDQCAAAYGGFHRFEYEDRTTRVLPLRIDPGFQARLERNLLVCYTGTSRVSGETIARVMGAYQRGDARVVGALHGLKETALAIGDALEHGDYAGVGGLLHQNWQLQQALDPCMRTPAMEALESSLRAAGALGGKAAGAGAGGCMFFLLPEGWEPGDVGDRVLAAGASVLPFRWSAEGVRTW
jgi:D-glycero-alpha-D-manno-heptose-7-phosphate kinase